MQRLTTCKLGNQVTLWILGNGMEKLYENEYIGMYGLDNQVTKVAFRTYCIAYPKSSASVVWVTR